MKKICLVSFLMILLISALPFHIQGADNSFDAYEHIYDYDNETSRFKEEFTSSLYTSGVLAKMDGIYYQISSDNSYYEVSGCDNNITNAKIASEINGLPVKTILSESFSDNNKLKKVYIPKSITNIPHNPFTGCKALKSIKVEDSNPIFHSKGNCLIETERSRLISGCKNSKIPDYVVSIGAEAFMQCYNLKKVVIPESVTYIEKFAFSKCYNLKKVVIPDGVKHIEKHTFSECYNLKTVVIPDGVTYIEESAFSECYKLKNITIPSSVYIISDFAFSDCKKLRYVEIPQKTTLAYGVFDNCSNLKDIYFEYENLGVYPLLHGTKSLGCDATIHWGCKMPTSKKILNAVDFDSFIVITLLCSAIFFTMVAIAATIFIVYSKKSKPNSKCRV